MACIRKRKWANADGHLRTAFIVDYVDGQSVRRRKQFLRFKEADRFRIGVERQLSDGTYRPDADKIIVSDACSSFLDHCRDRLVRDERMTRKTLTVYRGHVTNYILGSDIGIAGYKLARLSARPVNEFRDRIRSAGVSVPTTRKVLATLHAILEHAISQDWIAVNAATGIKVIGPRDEGPIKIVPPSKADLKSILETADDDTHFMILFAATTGVRAGEQWALRWHDVDFEEESLSICRRIDSYGEEGPPKSVAGVRKVPLSGKLAHKLKEKKLKSDFSDEDDFVFPNKLGRHTCHDNMVKRRFKPAQTTAGVSDISWHSLRHFAVSTWIEAGLPPKTVQTFAGHSSLQVTMDRYGHLFPSDNHRAAMDSIVGDLIG